MFEVNEAKKKSSREWCRETGLEATTDEGTSVYQVPEVGGNH